MKPAIVISFVIFLALSTASVLMSGAPAKVHLVSIASFFLAYFVGAYIAESGLIDKPKWLIWIAAGFVGLLGFDIFSSLVIVKRDFLMGWYVIYPGGLLGLLVLQLFAKWVAIPYYKQVDA